MPNTKEWLENNKDKTKMYNKKYRENNKEKIKMYKKEYNENNKDKIKEKTKEYRENNKEKIKDKKEYNENNKEKKSIVHKKSLVSVVVKLHDITSQDILKMILIKTECKKSSKTSVALDVF
jgi:hypothetical protein